MAVHYQKGLGNRVAFVFSCPGRYEQTAGCPAAKVTGVNLQKLLEILTEIFERNDLSREQITVTNAWSRIEYKELTGRSEATDEEIQMSENISRLQCELEHVEEFMVFCWKMALTSYCLKQPLKLLMCQSA